LHVVSVSFSFQVKTNIILPAKLRNPEIH